MSRLTRFHTVRLTVQDDDALSALAQRLGIKPATAARQALRDGLVCGIGLDAKARAILTDLAALDGRPAGVVLAQLIRDAARRKLAGVE